MLRRTAGYIATRPKKYEETPRIARSRDESRDRDEWESDRVGLLDPTARIAETARRPLSSSYRLAPLFLFQYTLTLINCELFFGRSRFALCAREKYIFSIFFNFTFINVARFFHQQLRKATAE